MTEDRGAFKTNHTASHPNSAKSDVPSRPWPQCRKPPKSDVSDFLHHLWQRNLTTGEQRLRYPRIKPDSRKRTQLIHHQ
jgi:hypothetical protein